MSLVDDWGDEWQAPASGGKGRTGRLDSGSDMEELQDDSDDMNRSLTSSGSARQRRKKSRAYSSPPKRDPEEHIFALEKLHIQIARHHGEIVSLSSGAGVLLVATLSGAVIRANEEEDQLEEMLIPKKTSEDTIHQVFMDPLGVHGLVSMKSGQVFYLHEGKKKPISMSKMSKNVGMIESVAWDLLNDSETSTSHFLVGTSQGLIFEASIENLKEKVCTQRYSLNDTTERKAGVAPVCGLRMHRYPPKGKTERMFVMASTPTRYYQFVANCNSIEALFNHYGHGTLPRFNELPSDLDYSELRFFNKEFDKQPPSAYSLLFGAGIFHGQLNFNNSSSIVGDGELLGFPPALGGTPSSIMLTEFHHILLAPRQIIALSRLNEKQVWQTSNLATDTEKLKKFVWDVDAEVLYVYSDRHVYEIRITEEERDVWKLYLEQKNFDMAMKYATEEQKQEILTIQADYYYAERKYKEAAATYALTDRSFEEITLKFVSTGSSVALKTYLLSKLDKLDVVDLTQTAMLSTWLTEIFLNHLNTLQGVTSGNDDLKEFFGNAKVPKYTSELPVNPEQRRKEYEDEVEAFHEFLSYYSDCLNKETTFDLIASHGRMEDLLFFAKETGDTDWVLNYYIQNEQWSKVLELLRKNESPELYYKFCPVVLPHAPKETVDALIRAPGLDPSQLIPALMRYESQQESKRQAEAKASSAAGSRRARIRDDQVIRYLDHCVRRGNSDPALHNYLISLYAAADDEIPILRFIDEQKSNPHFDTNYCLRLCHAQKKYKACVATYVAMKRFEDAVQLALSVDVNLAKVVVEESVSHTKEHERKRLWLLIAKQLLKEDQKGGVQKAMNLLKESDLRLQDILPLKEFPDFEQIGAFKAEICKSLNTYKDEMNKLRTKMNEFTSSAEALRSDINKLRERSGKVTSNQKCDLCSKPVLTRQFYLFPCSHVFHADCMVEKAREYLQKYPIELQKLHERKIAQEKRERTESLSLSSPRRKEELIKEFSHSQCYFCGDIMIQSVNEPFIKLPEEREELESWEIPF